MVPDDATEPTIIRACLPTPDAVIVRDAGGVYVVADVSLSDERVDEIAREAPHVRDGRPFGGPMTRDEGPPYALG